MAAVELGRIAAGLILDPTHAQEVIVEDLTVVELVAVGYADRHERFFLNFHRSSRIQHFACSHSVVKIGHYAVRSTRSEGEVATSHF